MTHHFTSRYSAEILISLVISVMILVCYQPVSNYGFINYDDPIYVIDNEHVRAGITSEGLIWAFRDIKSSNWQSWLRSSTKEERWNRRTDPFNGRPPG